jgi:hypothetical protein
MNNQSCQLANLPKKIDAAKNCIDEEQSEGPASRSGSNLSIDRTPGNPLTG